MKPWLLRATGLITLVLVGGCASPLAWTPPPPPSVTAAVCTAAAQNSSRIGFYAPSTQALTAVEQLTGVQAAWTLTYPNFGAPFDAAAACQSSEAGATPIVQLDPYHATLASIAGGKYDAYLRTYAQAVKAFHAPVILSFGHEMNGNWYPWGVDHARPAMFVAAWRRMVTIFRQQGAANATWMWTVNVDRVGAPNAYNPAVWWPGPQYVGMIGIDGYFRYPGDVWPGVFSNVINQVRQIAPRLPVLLSETAVEIDATSAAQTASLFQGVLDNHMIGFVWFNRNADKDWLLQDDPAALTAFRAAVPTYEHS